MKRKKDLYYFNNYKSNFLIGSTSCFSFLGSYPTTFVNNYISFSNEEEKDTHDILCDWKAVGKDIINGEKRFVNNYLNDSRYKDAFPTT